MATIKIESEVNARVLQINAAAGERIEADDVLLVVESMKMEIPVLAPAPGTIAAVHVKPGDTIEEDQLLAELDAE